MGAKTRRGEIKKEKKPTLANHAKVYRKRPSARTPRQARTAREKTKTGSLSDPDETETPIHRNLAQKKVQEGNEHLKLAPFYPVPELPSVPDLPVPVL